ncbi:MAG: ATP-dependent RNA helicase RhlE [Firmicutes bacterium ADurb.Bin080]|nr:MAG: ATP-dependent RNA helicase RhlE [Firmicutes bacterium ADurb.Bin080]
MFNPAKAADEIKKEYIGYIATTFHFRDQRLQSKLLAELDATISNGPFVEIKDTFITGKTIRELVVEGLLSLRFFDLERQKKPEYSRKLPLDRPLYLHQEKAIEKIVSGKNVVVSTGTGSGKTDCFLIPVINELLREEELGTLDDGVRAIFIYPMNALANDQIKGLREILMNYPSIKFGVYNGGTENNESVAIKLYEEMFKNEKYPDLQKRLDNEMLSRDEMKKHPPHILFTNYAMLEHLLIRPGDDVLFSRSNFKYVVLDEAHVYAGATGIETALLMGRLKGRLNGDKKPQFILTSATLGDGSKDSNSRIVNFANSLTGCEFFQDDIINAYRNNTQKFSRKYTHNTKLYIDLANEENDIKDTLSLHSIPYDTNEKEDNTILYELIIETDLYANMRGLGSLITFETFVGQLGITRDVAVAFISLCARAQKQGKPLVDIRYHFFLRALDGGYLALDYPQSFSLTRKDYYKDQVKMFEISVCEDCGEIAIVGQIKDGKIHRITIGDELEFFQIIDQDDEIGYDNNEDVETGISLSNSKKKLSTDYVLCKNCGAIVSLDEAHNKWCNCGNNQPVIVRKLLKDNCLNCNGSIRKLNLGYEAATGVIATSLFEQIPEYSVKNHNFNSKVQQRGIFGATVEQKKQKTATCGQFLIFSDSRQGAAKFACFLGDSYKEFLRRRGIWNVALEEQDRFFNGIPLCEFAKLLDNYFSSKKLFRQSNIDNASSSMVENRRNAWIAVLNEMFNSNRDTSLVSLGKIQFEYLGNTGDIVQAVVGKYNVKKQDARSFLNFLAFEIIRAGAIVTEKDNDINDSDRKYIFYSSNQKVITKDKDKSIKNSTPFLPTPIQKKDGSVGYFRSNKLMLAKSFLKIDDSQALELLEDYWNWLVMKDNPYHLIPFEKGYVAKPDSFIVYIGKNATLWKCDKCQKVTPYNICGNCIKPNCHGHLTRLDTNEFCKDNFYAKRYESDKLSPLLVKEHTAQLAKKEALEYQQLFIRKEINALSCSTTFEMGVDVGDLETVFLRNIPPLASNYAQRVGRAGRTINAAAFALTFARLSSHDFNFFDRPEEMVNGIIYPPQFKLENEKIIKRHIYAVAISLFLKNNPDMYQGNNANRFLNDKGYQQLLDWLETRPADLKDLLKNSFPRELWKIPGIDIENFAWLEDFCGLNGRFTLLISEYENNIEFLEKEIDKAWNAKDANTQNIFEHKLERYKKNDFIPFLVRGNILPKYGFPIDSVELSQNISSKGFKSLNLSRDLSVAIAEYAPSAEVVADGKLYTSRYIRKPIVNKNELNNFETSYIANCPDCKNINYRNMPIPIDGIPCSVCNKKLTKVNFHNSIEPRAGFIAEKEVLDDVPLASQERKYKTEAIYIGDKNNVSTIDKYEYTFGKIKIIVESTTNDSLVVKSTDYFYVCPRCGYSIASDETSKLNKYSDYKYGVHSISNDESHENPFGKGKCENTRLERYWLHHEFKTDVAKITFETDTSDSETMYSVMYALLNSFANTLSIEKHDIKACLTYKRENGKYEHKIIIYDSVPGGAGHSRRLVTNDGVVLKKVIENAIDIMRNCNCEPSCYKCLRNYENQKIHEILDRKKALGFLELLLKK